MATPTSRSTPAKADKVLARQIAAIVDVLDNSDEFLGLMRDNAVKAPFAKDLAALRKRLDTAGESQDRGRAGKELAALYKEAKALVDRAGHASRLEFAQREWRELRAKAAGLLAQAMVETAQIDPPALRAPLQKDQLGLKAELDRAEKLNDLLKAIAAFEVIIPRVEALLERLGVAGVAAAWLKTRYRPLVARVQTAIQKVGADRERKTLLAEIDFTEVDVIKALAKADIKAAELRAMPQLQSLERAAARIVGLSAVKP